MKKPTKRNRKTGSGQVERLVRPLRFKVSRSQYAELKKLKMPASLIELTRVLGEDKAFAILSATHHDRPMEAIVA